jgi:hypothetical protein
MASRVTGRDRADSGWYWKQNYETRDPVPHDPPSACGNPGRMLKL